MTTTHRHRRGTILIIVAGVTALLIGLSLAFLVRMRNDSEEMDIVMRESQSRIMLMAGCNYVQECSRLGWNMPGDADRIRHKEAYGWIDVRDGSVGPSIDNGVDAQVPVKVWSAALVEDGDGDGSKDRPAWPAPGSVVRCPMHVMQRPPFATQLTANYNPIVTDVDSPDFGMPYLTKADPQTFTGDRAKFWAGDRAPRQNSVNLSWFRCYREAAQDTVPAPAEAARFIVTCGAGATQGFSSWDEVRGAGRTDIFNDDPSLFGEFLKEEVRLWFRIEWTAAIKDVTYHCIENDLGTNDIDNYTWFAMNASTKAAVAGGTSSRTQSHSRNMVGTIRWVQRLATAPTFW
jgi:hypothetical protein